MKLHIFSLAFYGAALLGFAALPSARLAAQDAGRMEVSQSVAGDWSAERNGTTLTIRLLREQGVWNGWFVSRKSGGLYPLKDVMVHDRSVAFTFASDPVLNFNLVLANDGATLDGDAELPDGLVLPYAFKRTATQ